MTLCLYVDVAWLLQYSSDLCCNFSWVPDLPPPFGCDEQPANPVELKRLVSLPPILTPRKDGEHIDLLKIRENLALYGIDLLQRLTPPNMLHCQRRVTQKIALHALYHHGRAVNVQSRRLAVTIPLNVYFLIILHAA